MKYYLLFIWRNIEPELSKPFNTPEQRDAFARRKYQLKGPEHGYFQLESEGKIGLECFSAAELEKS